MNDNFDAITNAIYTKKALVGLLTAKEAQIMRWGVEYQKLDEKLEQALRKTEDHATLITELVLGIDAVQLDTCTDEDWDRLNEVAQRAREATK